MCGFGAAVCAQVLREDVQALGGRLPPRQCGGGQRARHRRQTHQELSAPRHQAHSAGVRAHPARVHESQ